MLFLHLVHQWCDSIITASDHTACKECSWRLQTYIHTKKNTHNPYNIAANLSRPLWPLSLVISLLTWPWVHVSVLEWRVRPLTLTCPRPRLGLGAVKVGNVNPEASPEDSSQRRVGNLSSNTRCPLFLVVARGSCSSLTSTSASAAIINPTFSKNVPISAPQSARQGRRWCCKVYSQQQ